LPDVVSDVLNEFYIVCMDLILNCNKPEKHCLLHTAGMQVCRPHCLHQPVCITTRPTSTKHFHHKW